MSSYHDESSESLFNLLPKDLITEILIRTPSKSLCRLKSVSKRFNSLISHPHFLPLYVSRGFTPPSWFILDRVPQLGPKSSQATQFQLLNRPKISTCSINPRKLGPKLVIDPDRCRYPTAIVQSSKGLILFALTYIRESDTKVPDRFSWILEEEAFYVVNPISNEWFGLPEPIKAINQRTSVAFTARVDPETGVVGRFMVVDYQPLIGSENGTLSCFVSDTCEWVELNANYMLELHKWMSGGAFEFDGKLFWVDLGVGLITWDVKDNDYFQEVKSRERGVCRFIPLPKGRRKRNYTLELAYERWVGVGGEFVQFMEVFKKGHCVLKLWKLNNCGGEEWSLMYEVSRKSVERFLTCESGRGGTGLPTPCFFHPFEPDVAYFQTADRIFSFNLRTLQVGDVHVLTPHEFVLPFVLPKWPSPIPKRLYVAFANKMGNEFLRNQNFTEAIICYSRSIDLSPDKATFVYRAMAYLKANKNQEAENDCTECLKLDANYVKAYCFRAIARKELGNFKGALEDIELGHKLEPENERVKKLRPLLKSMFEKVSSVGYEYCPESAACGKDMEGN